MLLSGNLTPVVVTTILAAAASVVNQRPYACLTSNSRSTSVRRNRRSPRGPTRQEFSNSCRDQRRTVLGWTLSDRAACPTVSSSDGEFLLLLSNKAPSLDWLNLSKPDKSYHFIYTQAGSRKGQKKALGALGKVKIQ